jgi:D-3-phosphoglycerate dehydrogenase/C-terminal binding protein
MRWSSTGCASTQPSWRASKRCRLVVRNGVGYDVLDLEALGEAGIAACNVPDYGTTEVSDSAIAMMLAFARGTLAYDTRAAGGSEDRWTPRAQRHCAPAAGSDFRADRDGAHRHRVGPARPRVRHERRVLRSLPAERDRALLGFTRAKTLKELLGMADVVCIHADLTRENRGMVNADAVAAMKPGAYVINTARGPICDTAALLAGLKSGKLAAVGLDVLPKEPGGMDDPLVAAWHANEPWIRGRVILGPHGAVFSPDAFADVRAKCAETVDRLPARREAAELREYGIPEDIADDP